MSNKQNKETPYIDSEIVYTEFCDIWIRTFNKDAVYNKNINWSTGHNRTLSVIQSDASWHIEDTLMNTEQLSEGLSIERPSTVQYRPITLAEPTKNLIVQITEYR